MATSFVPNARTAPTMVTDERDYIQTTSQRIKADVKDRIVSWEPEAAPMTVLTKKLGRTRTVSQYSFDTLEKEPYPRTVQVSGAQTSGDTAVEFASGQGARLFKYAVVRNQRTGEVFWVSSMATDTATVTRGIGGFTAAMLDGDYCEILGSAYEDGSSKGTLKSVKETRTYNLCQIVRTPFGSTGRQSVTGLYGGKDPMTERKAQAVEHRKSIEMFMFFGQRHSTTGPNSRTLAFMGGLKYFIQSNVWNTGGFEPTERQFNEMLEYAMRWGDGGNMQSSGNKVLFASPRWQTIFDSWGRDKIRYSTSDNSLGLKVGTYVSSHGEIKVVRQPLFVGKNAQYCFLVDLNHAAYVSHVDRDTKLVENIQANDVDGFEEEYITDCSLDLEIEAAHAVFEGIPV